MEGEIERPDPTRMRVSDADRHQVAEILRTAAGEGRLELDELDERLEATYAAKTYADLVPLTFDLPDVTGRPGAPGVPAPLARAAEQSARIVPRPGSSENHLAIMSGVDRRGEWIVPERMTVLAMMGGANLDMREARFAATEVVVTVNAFMGGASIVVGPDVNVVMEGVGIMGGYSGPSGGVDAELSVSSPTLRVRGVAIWGGVSVERKARDEPGRRSLHRGH